MKITRLLFAFFLISRVDLAIAEPATHCTHDEITFFTCQIQNSTKIASFCGGNNQNSNKIAWLQYRFGDINNTEIIYPLVKKQSVKKFTGSSEHSREMSYFEYDIWFDIGSYIYNLSVFESGNEPTGRSITVYHKSPYRIVTALTCLKDESAIVDHVERLESKLTEHQN